MTEPTTTSVESPPPVASPWQFSLRALFVALTIACIVSAWLVNPYRAKQAALDRLREVGVMLNFDYQRTDDGQWKEDPDLPGQPWLRAFLGDHYAANAVSVMHFGMRAQEFTDAEAALLAENFPTVRSILFQHVRLTDAGLLRLQEIPALKELTIDGTQVTQEGARAFRAARPTVQFHFSVSGLHIM